MELSHSDLDFFSSSFSFTIQPSSGGKDTAFGRDHDFEYLEKQHIFEYGLEEHFMERYNLSVMTHYLFMPELDLKLLENGLVGYVRLFRESLENDVASSNEGEGSFWRTFMQLIMLVRRKQGQRTA